MTYWLGWLCWLWAFMSNTWPSKGCTAKVEVESTSQLRYGICLDTLYLVPDPSFVSCEIKTKKQLFDWTIQHHDSRVVQMDGSKQRAFTIQQTKLKNRAVFLFREKSTRMKPVLYSAAAWSVGTQVIRADRVDQLPVFSYADGHQPCSRGLYTHYYIIYKDSLLKVDDHSQYMEFWP